MSVLSIFSLFSFSLIFSANKQYLFDFPYTSTVTPKKITVKGSIVFQLYCKDKIKNSITETIVSLLLSLFRISIFTPKLIPPDDGFSWSYLSLFPTRVLPQLICAARRTQQKLPQTLELAAFLEIIIILFIAIQP